MEPDDDIEEVEDLEEEDDFSSGEVECDICERPGVASTPDGDWLCEVCYEEWQMAESDPWWEDDDDDEDREEL